MCYENVLYLHLETYQFCFNDSIALLSGNPISVNVLRDVLSTMLFSSLGSSPMHE